MKGFEIEAFFRKFSYLSHPRAISPHWLKIKWLFAENRKSQTNGGENKSSLVLSVTFIFFWFFKIFLWCWIFLCKLIWNRRAWFVLLLIWYIWQLRRESLIAINKICYDQLEVGHLFFKLSTSFISNHPLTPAQVKLEKLDNLKEHKWTSHILFLPIIETS